MIENWPWIITPDYVNVAVITNEGQYIVFRQTKYSVKGTTLALVGGYIEPGEEPLAAAKRELLEETGFAAEHWENLGEFSVDGSRGNGIAHFFLAREASPVPKGTRMTLKNRICCSSPVQRWKRRSPAAHSKCWPGKL